MVRGSTLRVFFRVAIESYSDVFLSRLDCPNNVRNLKFYPCPVHVIIDLSFLVHVNIFAHM